MCWYDCSRVVRPDAKLSASTGHMPWTVENLVVLDREVWEGGRGFYSCVYIMFFLSLGEYN